jgi:SAM-dependent methyltransferase
METITDWWNVFKNAIKTDPYFAAFVIMFVIIVSYYIINQYFAPYIQSIIQDAKHLPKPQNLDDFWEFMQDYETTDKSITESFADYKEEFSSSDPQIIITENDKIYDRFYAKIYDKLFYNAPKITFEVGDLKAKTMKGMAREDVDILDIGCGTGRHCELFSRKFKTTGIDTSPAMVRMAEANAAAAADIMVADAETTDEIFPAESFTHITAYYFVVYYMRNLSQFIANVAKWLRPGGWFVVHVVDPDKFDPLLEHASPFPAFSMQKYAKKGQRFTKSHVTFNKMEYIANFELDTKRGTAGTFTEEFIERNNGQFHRKQIH